MARPAILSTRPVRIEGFVPRHLRIALPPDHAADPHHPRPLLLLFDGQNVFHDQGSYAGGWHADRAMGRLAVRRLRPIVVGLDHGGPHRLTELSPYRVMGQTGRAHDFLSWVVHTLVPRLRRRFSVIEGPAGIALGGASVGGLAATYAHFTWPHIVGGALAMSPSFWIDDAAVASLLTHRPPPPVSKLYLDGGAKESKGTLAPRLRKVRRLLWDHGYPARSLHVEVDPKGTHDERSWRRRLPAALRWFYPLP